MTFKHELSRIDELVLISALLSTDPPTVDVVCARCGVDRATASVVLGRFTGLGFLSGVDGRVVPEIRHPEFWALASRLASSTTFTRLLFSGLSSAGITKVLMYGSFARLAAGELDRMPSDVDLMVVSDMSMLDAVFVAQRLDDVLGIEVSLRPYPQSLWDNPSGLLATVLTTHHMFLTDPDL